MTERWAHLVAWTSETVAGRVLREVVLVAVVVLEILPFVTLEPSQVFWGSVALVVAIPLRLLSPELGMVLGGLAVSWTLAVVGPALLMATLADRRRRGWWVALWCAAAIAVNVLPYVGAYPGSLQYDVVGAAKVAAVFVGGAAIGRLRRSRREQRAAYRELERSHERQALSAGDAARAQERAAMAREMHDIVSHQISLIALQAGALRASSDTPAVREAAEVIRVLSVRTNEELRALLGALRSGESYLAAAMPRGLHDVPVLWESSGLSGELRLEGDAAAVPMLVQRACFRAVQEALSNVRKHAPGSVVDVHVAVGCHEVRCTVTNTADRDARPSELSNGTGLQGLRERVELLHGVLAAAGTPDGGFALTVTFPSTAGCPGQGRPDVDPAASATDVGTAVRPGPARPA